ncbi:MAG: peptidylprolyl isomerase [SAR86 cluster bacterium]
MNRLISALFILALAQGCSQEQPAASKTTAEVEQTPAAVEPNAIDWRQHLTQPEMMTFDANTNYYWDLTTNVGDMRFRLFHATAPMHTTSTIFLTEQGFYDNVIFHRVIPGFMAQGGDPTGTGSGDPGYKYAGEFAGNLSHDKPGLLSMANAGPGTDGSQFFITFVATPFLDGKHTLFGELISGMETLKALEARGSRSGKTSETLTIIKAAIHQEPAAQ